MTRSDTAKPNRRRLFIASLLGGFALGVLTDLLWAQSTAAQDTAQARAIVQRHVAAMGDEAALNTGPVHMMMSMTMPGSGAAIRTESWRHGRRMYSRMSVPGMGTTEMGFDGTTAWMISPQLGAMILDSLPMDAMAAQHNARMFAGLPMRYLGEREMAGKRYAAVEFVHQGSRTTAYFDLASGLMAGMTPEKNPGPPGQMALSFGEWKRVGAMMYAREFTTRMADGQALVTRVESISLDTIDAKVFALPDVVRGLMPTKPPTR
jgi:hypothetical protein